MRLRNAAIILAGAIFVAACGGGGGDADPTATASITEAPPTLVPVPTDEPGVAIPDTAPATNITLPDGFTAYEIASGFTRTSSIALGADGTTYISERHGTVWRLTDADGDGVFEDRTAFAEGFVEITGLLADDGAVYVSSRGVVTIVRDNDGDGVGDAREEIITNLPAMRHQNNGLAFGPDGKLYVTNGSTCDDCIEANELSATILQANADGSDLRVYARGLRNPYDLAFDDAGRLWATDNGSDTPCETVDELNLITDGGDYGWPYGADGCDPFADGTAPVASLGLHTASTGVDIYEAAHFPEPYRGNVFATLWGSFVFDPELGPQLLRVDTGTGEVETFATGPTHPIDVAVDRDGTLLLLDYGSDDPSAPTGALYRIIYTGE